MNHADENRLTVTDLLPCPFCGGTPKIIRRGNAHTPSREVTIRCPFCRIQRTDKARRFSLEWLERAAISEWNHRQWWEPLLRELEQAAGDHDSNHDLAGANALLNFRDYIRSRTTGNQYPQGKAATASDETVTVKSPETKREQARGIINTLHSISQDYGVHEFGLPLFDESQYKLMVNAVLNVIDPRVSQAQSTSEGSNAD